MKIEYLRYNSYKRHPEATTRDTASTRPTVTGKGSVWKENVGFDLRTCRSCQAGSRDCLGSISVAQETEHEHTAYDSFCHHKNLMRGKGSRQSEIVQK